MVRRFEISSTVDGGAEAVWQRGSPPEGINDELMPIARMTMPRTFAGRTLADVTPGERLGRSWIFVLGFIPFDYDDIGIAEIGPG